MIKILLIVILLFNVNFASINNIDYKIKKSKKQLKVNYSKKAKKYSQIKGLGRQIKQQNKFLKTIEQKISMIDKDIQKHKLALYNSKNTLIKLSKSSKSLEKQKLINEKQIVNLIIDDFTSSIALKLASKSNVQELIDSQIYTILSQNSQYEIQRLNTSYELLSQNTKSNQNQINQISRYITTRQKSKKQLDMLKNKRSLSLISLEKKHITYQTQLKKVLKKQSSLEHLLKKLNIIKMKNRKNKQKKIQRISRLKKQNRYKKVSKLKNLTSNIRMLGSSTRSIKIVKYKGKKTIAPLDSFKVVKKFGKYFDPVYNIELFNESMILKTKKAQAKVKSIFNGKIVYAKKNVGMLENVVIIQHKNGLHTIYSHLDEIAPYLKVGRWIKKGYVVGRVNNTLIFQATKNESHINPKDLFRTL